MGLTTNQFLEMELWQYNAYCEAYQDRMIDDLSIQIQAAYLGAYWSGWSKHKKSLRSVLDSLRRKKVTHTKKEPIDVEKISEQFRQMEELKSYGWTRQ